MTKIRLSLLCLGFYLVLIGRGLLLAPQPTLKVLQSNGEMVTSFPRLAGMLMSGLGFAVFGLIRVIHRNSIPPRYSYERISFVCILAFYAMTDEPFFLLPLVVGLRFALGSYVIDRRNT